MESLSLISFNIKENISFIMVRNLRNTKGWNQLPNAEKQRRLAQQRFDLNQLPRNTNRAMTTARTPQNIQNNSLSPRAGRGRQRGRKQNNLSFPLGRNPTQPINETSSVSLVMLQNRSNYMQYFGPESSRYTSMGWQLGQLFGRLAYVPTNTPVPEFWGINPSQGLFQLLPAGAIILAVVTFIDIGAADKDVTNVASSYTSALVVDRATDARLMNPDLRMMSGAVNILFNKQSEMSHHQFMHVVPNHFRYNMNDNMYNALSLCFDTEGLDELGPSATFTQKIGFVYAAPLTLEPSGSANEASVDKFNVSSLGWRTGDNQPACYVKCNGSYYHWKHFLKYSDKLLKTPEQDKDELKAVLEKAKIEAVIEPAFGIGKYSLGPSYHVRNLKVVKEEIEDAE